MKKLFTLIAVAALMAACCGTANKKAKAAETEVVDGCCKSKCESECTEEKACCEGECEAAAETAEI